jgi:ubiquinone/menaquinone biosynthesis C-methylase UbiE
MAAGPVRDSRNPFALPRGPLGRLAGWIMARDDRPHREVAELLSPAPGAAVCEIGFGPGQLLGALAQRDPTVRLSGVDPSPVMLGQARRRLPTSADLRVGAAGALPFADHSADHIVAVNTVALWPDVPAALADCHRVLRPGGSLLLAWHSTAAPSSLRRRMGQPDRWWNDLMATLRHEFGNAERHDLTHLTAATATA